MIHPQAPQLLPELLLGAVQAPLGTALGQPALLGRGEGGRVVRVELNLVAVALADRQRLCRCQVADLVKRPVPGRRDLDEQRRPVYRFRRPLRRAFRFFRTPSTVTALASSRRRMTSFKSVFGSSRASLICSTVNAG